MANPRPPRLGAIFLTIVLDLLGFGLVLPFLAEVARDTFHVTAFVGTLLAPAYSLMQFLFVPVWGSLSDRVGRKPVLTWSIGATAVANAALCLALAYGQSVLWLFAARIFAGIATANLGTASAYIADVTPPKDRAKGMGLIGMAFGIGFILGPGFGGVLAQVPMNGRHGPWALLAAAALSAINLVWVMVGLGESLPKEVREARGEVARRLPLDFAAMARVLRDGNIARAVAANFTLILFFSGMEQTLRYFNKDAFEMSLGETGGLLAMVGVTAAAVQGGLVRRLSGRIEDASMLRWGLLLQAIAFGGLAASPSVGRWFLYASAMVLAVGNGLSQPAVSAYVSKCADPAAQGSTLGVAQSMSSLARVFGPALAGALYGSALGVRSPFALACVGTAVSLLLALPLRDRVLQSTSTQMS